MTNKAKCYPDIFNRSVRFVIPVSESVNLRDMLTDVTAGHYELGGMVRVSAIYSTVEQLDDSSQASACPTIRHIGPDGQFKKLEDGSGYQATFEFNGTRREKGQETKLCRYEATVNMDNDTNLSIISHHLNGDPAGAIEITANIIRANISMDNQCFYLRNEDRVILRVKPGEELSITDVILDPVVAEQMAKTPFIMLSGVQIGSMLYSGLSALSQASFIGRLGGPDEERLLLNLDYHATANAGVIGSEPVEFDIRAIYNIETKKLIVNKATVDGQDASMVELCFMHF